MISLFDKELLEMEREVRDLKTYCRHGLGNTRFYTKEMTIEATMANIYSITAETILGEPTPAFITIYFAVSPYVRYATGTTATETKRILQFLPVNGSTTLFIKAISTSDLSLSEEHQPYV